MLISLLLNVISIVAQIFQSFLPSASFWPLPTGITDAATWLGARIGTAAAFLPSGVLTNLTLALTLLAAVKLFVIPWLAARGFRLPFAAMTKA